MKVCRTSVHYALPCLLACLRRCDTWLVVWALGCTAQREHSTIKLSLVIDLLFVHCAISPLILMNSKQFTLKHNRLEFRLDAEDIPKRIPFYLLSPCLTHHHDFMLRLCCGFYIMLEIVKRDLFRSGLLILLRALLFTNSIISRLNVNAHILAHVCECASICSCSCSFCQLHKKLAYELHMHLISWSNTGNVLRKRHFTLSVLDGVVKFSLKKKDKSFSTNKKTINWLVCACAWMCACVFFLLQTFCHERHHRHTCDALHCTVLQKEKQQNDDFPTVSL